MSTLTGCATLAPDQRCALTRRGPWRAPLQPQTVAPPSRPAGSPTPPGAQPSGPNRSRHNPRRRPHPPDPAGPMAYRDDQVVRSVEAMCSHLMPVVGIGPSPAGLLGGVSKGHQIACPSRRNRLTQGSQ